MKIGTVVVFKKPIDRRSEAAKRREPTPERIPGRWKVFDRSPTGWWLLPNDVESHEYVRTHPTVSGCISAPTSQIESAFLVDQQREGKR